MEKKYDKFEMGLACSFTSCVVFMITIIVFETKYPNHPEFTKHIENVTAVKFMTPDRQYYYVVDEKIGNQTRKVILQPILTLDAEGDNNKSSDSSL